MLINLQLQKYVEVSEKQQEGISGVMNLYLKNVDELTKMILEHTKTIEVIEVPDGHGRLIDADELRKEYKRPMDWLDKKEVMYHVTGIWASIDNAPTIVPSDKERA